MCSVFDVKYGILHITGIGGYGMLADVTSDLIDHLTALWMLILFLLSWHRYPEY